MLGAEVGGHVGLHEVELHVGAHHEVEADHLEERALVRVAVEGIDEGLLQSNTVQTTTYTALVQDILV